MRRLLVRGLVNAPLPRSLALVSTAARALVRAAAYTRVARLPPDVAGFPHGIESLFGHASERAAAARLREQRLVYLWTVRLVARVFLVRPVSAARELRPLIDVRGVDHVVAALRGRRGVLLVSAHYGYLPILAPVLQERSVGQVTIHRAIQQRPHDQDADTVRVAVGGDVWDRTRALQQARTELANNRACVVLADEWAGRAIDVPFFTSHVSIRLGPFALARRADCPVVPFFTSRAPDTQRFLVEFGSPLSSASGPEDHTLNAAAHEFAERFRQQVRQRPCHIHPTSSLARIPFERAAETAVSGAARELR